MLGLSLSTVSAAEYAILVVAAADTTDQPTCLQLQATSLELNALHLRHPKIHPWFSVVACSDGKQRLVFGWLPPVTGLIAEDFPNMAKALGRYQRGTTLQPHWVSKAAYLAWSPELVAVAASEAEPPRRAHHAANSPSP